MNTPSPMTPDWGSFSLAPPGAHADAPRSIQTTDGIGDRLRAAAFAEIQARDAFFWAADHFQSAPTDLREAWRRLALSEQRHLDWLLNRMQELRIAIEERKVSDHLWHSLVACTTERDFALFMATAEERGRKAGERFYQALLTTDPTTAQIFGKIAEEEVAHIALAKRFFPDA